MNRGGKSLAFKSEVRDGRTTALRLAYTIQGAPPQKKKRKKNNHICNTQRKKNSSQGLNLGVPVTVPLLTTSFGEIKRQ